ALPTSPDTATDDTDAPLPPPEPSPLSRAVRVTVTLDGAPVEGAMVTQGGVVERWSTGPDGRVTVPVDFTVEGDIHVIAGHPEARTTSEAVPDDGDAVTIALHRYDPSDNPDYAFRHPGTPEINESTAYCSHCHVSIN